jgi:hypothetical protein
MLTGELSIWSITETQVVTDDHITPLTPRPIDGDVLPLRIALEHSFE